MNNLKNGDLLYGIDILDKGISIKDFIGLIYSNEDFRSSEIELTTRL